MPRRSCCTAVIAALLLAAPTAQASTVGFSSLWVFGDSLSDPGNLYDLTSNFVPPLAQPVPETPPYARRRSDGPVWAEPISARYEAKGLPNANFAYAFANAIPNVDPFPFQIPDLPDQIAAFKATALDRLGHRPVAAVWIGPNDYFGQVAIDPSPAAVAAKMVAAASAVTGGIQELGASGVRDFVVLNMPPLDLTPASLLQGPQAVALGGFATSVFNGALASGLSALSAGGLSINAFDIEDAIREVVGNPGAFGFADVTTPCYFPGSPPESRCSEEQAAVSLFFDLVHPTQVGHAEIARRIGPDLAPVPLPAPALLLLLGLAGLGVAASRRATA